MKFNRWKVVEWVYAGLGLAGTLAILRLGLRLLAADELNPVGKWLAVAGGWAVAPFKLFFRSQTTPVLPGSSFEPEALVAALVYAGLVVAVAAGVALLKLWQSHLKTKSVSVSEQ